MDILSHSPMVLLISSVICTCTSAWILTSLLPAYIYKGKCMGFYVMYVSCCKHRQTEGYVTFDELYDQQLIFLTCTLSYMKLLQDFLVIAIYLVLSSLLAKSFVRLQLAKSFVQQRQIQDVCKKCMHNLVLLNINSYAENTLNPKQWQLF